MSWHPICFICRLLDVNSLFMWLVRLFCNVCSLARWQSSTWKTPSCVCEEEHWCSLVSCASRHAQLGDSRLWEPMGNFVSQIGGRKTTFPFQACTERTTTLSTGLRWFVWRYHAIKAHKKKETTSESKTYVYKVFWWKKKSLTLVLH